MDRELFFIMPKAVMLSFLCAAGAANPFSGFGGGAFGQPSTPGGAFGQPSGNALTATDSLCL